MADKNWQDTESEPSEYETDSGEEGESLTSPIQVEKKPPPSSIPKSSSTPKTLEKPQNVPEPSDDEDDDGDDDSSSEEEEEKEANPKSEQVLKKTSIFSTRKALETAPNSSSDDEDGGDDDDDADSSSEQGLGSKSEHVSTMPSHSSSPKAEKILTLLSPKPLKQQPPPSSSSHDEDVDSSSEEEANPKSEQVLKNPSISSTQKAPEKAPSSSSDDEDGDDDDDADAYSDLGLGSKSEQVNTMLSHSSSPKALEKIQTLLSPKPLKHVMGFILKKKPLKQQQQRPSSSSDGEDDDAASEEVSGQFLKRASPSSTPKALEKSQTLSLKTPKQPPSSSSEDEDDDASSEEVSEPEPRQSINAKETVLSSRKRPAEEEKVFDAKVSKKQKKDEVEKSEKKPVASTKTIPFQKLWSDEDVLALLHGLIDFKKSNMDYSVGVFHDSIKEDLHLQYSRTQCGDKISKLRQKYLKNEKREKEGKNGSSLNPFDRKVYKLSKKLWGNGNGVEKAGAVAKVSEGGKGNDFEKTGAVGEGYDSQREWKKLEIEEFEIYLMQLDVQRKQAKLVWEALKSRYS